MTYFPIDDLAPGESVRLLVRVQNPYLDKFPPLSPVTVTRTATGFTYESAGCTTAGFLDGKPRVNPGHQGLNAHVKAACGAPYAIGSAAESDLVRQVYRLERRRVSTSRKGPGAAQALARARETVAACIEAGRDAPDSYHGTIWGGHGGSDGRVFAAYGESRLRWIENPESKGLRFVGLAHEAAPAGHAYYSPAVETTGWFLDDFQNETVSGVVYRLPAKGGRPRYLYGYADPFNADKDGRGPACLSLNMIEGEATDSGYDLDPVLRDVARYADSVAESYAEESREFESAYQAGARAAGLAREARKACSAWAAAVRDLRRLWPDRAAVLPHGAPVRDLVRGKIKESREACAAFIEAREAARGARARRARGRADSPGVDGWREGYAAGAWL